MGRWPPKISPLRCARSVHRSPPASPPAEESPRIYCGGPFEHLLGELADMSNVADLVLAGEHHLADQRVRPDYAG
jgi:hypothetical protein